MGNGYAQPRRLLLGMGDIYINDVFVGNAKGSVEFQYTPEYAYQRPGNSIADVEAQRTSENVVLRTQICDFKTAQLRRALGINQAVFSGTSTMRVQDVLGLSGTADLSLTKTAVAGTMKVTKLDRSTNYVSGTDYSATASTIARKSGGSITDPENVIVEYDVSQANTNAVQVGGEKTTPNTFRVDFVHKDASGKLIQVTLYKALVTTDLTLAFSEKQSGTYTVHDLMFKALVDTTKVMGKNMFEIVEEDPS